MSLERRTPLKRSPMKRTASQLKRTAIKPKPKGKAAAEQEFSPAVKAEAWRRAGGHCRFPGCRRTTWIVYHHIWRRGQGGPGTVENCAPLCVPHHEHVHANITEARELGLLSRG